MVNIFNKLFPKEGFPKVELRPKGRSGFLVYVEEAQECAMEFEISGNAEYDILAFSETIIKWSTGKTVSNEDKEEILKSFKKWAESKNYRVQW